MTPAQPLLLTPGTAGAGNPPVRSGARMTQRAVVPKTPAAGGALTPVTSRRALNLRSLLNLGRAVTGAARSFYRPLSGGPSTCGPSGESAPQAERLERRMGLPSAVITSHQQARRADRAAAWGRGGPVGTLVCRRGCPSPAAHYPHLCQRLRGVAMGAAGLRPSLARKLSAGAPARTPAKMRKDTASPAPNPPHFCQRLTGADTSAAAWNADTRGNMAMPLSATVAPSGAVAGSWTNNRLWGRRSSDRPALDLPLSGGVLVEVTARNKGTPEVGTPTAHPPSAAQSKQPQFCATRGNSGLETGGLPKRQTFDFAAALDNQETAA